jgi:lipopolysaccharide/colanic/teichoic acid biosynthesis glycosyltransferase
LTHAIKRGVDIMVAAILLIASLPVLIVITLAIKLSSRGPVLFIQDRIGLNKQRFKIYKFRTMIPDAERYLSDSFLRNDTGGAAFKMKDDPRVTAIGRVLRKFSLDELPQLFNVLLGNMSLVGPRPLTVKDLESFPENEYHRRFRVKPGITCLYQISGRSLLSFDQWMLLDLRYVDQWSLWLDFSILARTIPVVVKGVGAV